jgi:hypothetical protein
MPGEETETQNESAADSLLRRNDISYRQTTDRRGGEPKRMIETGRSSVMKRLGGEMASTKPAVPWPARGRGPQWWPR